MRPMTWEIRHGDCLELMRAMPDNSVDAVVTDPPYGLSFMGKKWDYDVPSTEVWAECLRVLKPGGHLLAFAGTRTQHRMAVRIEDAGFEIRDMIAWVYGSGFPKSLDVSKAIDKAAGAEREVIGTSTHIHSRGASTAFAKRPGEKEQAAPQTAERGNIITAPATDAARQWQGCGTALKPAMEPITVARKPLVGTVAANVLEHGTGALNIDGCRVGTTKNVPASVSKKAPANCYGKFAEGGETAGVGGHDPNLGRWPSNLIHDGSAEEVGLFPQSKSPEKVTRGGKTFHGGTYDARGTDVPCYGDTGSAARFFYCAKASKRDRDEGLQTMPKDVVRVTNTGHTGNPSAQSGERKFIPRANHHPTVKPTALMRYLCRLVTPPGGTVLDPFTGSGSTGKAAILEGFNFIGCEREAEYVDIARARIAHVEANPEPKPQQLSIFDTP